MNQNLGMVLHIPLYNADGDSFISRDAYGHPCTASGALWKPGGREFPGANAGINCGSGPALDNLGTTDNYQFSIGVWINPDSLGQNSSGRIIAKNGSASRGFQLQCTPTQTALFGVYFGGTAREVVAPSNSAPLFAWSYIVGVYDGANLLMYVNNVLTVGPARTGAIDAHASDDLYIGNRSNNDRCFDGLIGEVMVHNRALTPQEINRIYLETKWRYQ